MASFPNLKSSYALKYKSNLTMIKVENTVEALKTAINTCMFTARKFQKRFRVVFKVY